MRSKYYLSSIYFYPTGKCNLKCSHCWINPPYQRDPVEDEEELSLEEIKKMIDDGMSLGMRSVKLTGGEPFLRKDILKILQYIVDKELRLTIETNGTLITEEIADILKEANAKKKLFISTSIDGYNAYQHEKIRGIKGCFDLALQGIATLKKKGISVQMITVLYRGNKDDIEKIIGLAEESEVNSLKLNIMSFIARGDVMHRKGHALTIQELIEINNLLDYHLRPRYKMNIIYDIPPVLRNSEIGKTSKIASRYRCNLFGILGVLSDGSVSLCGIGTSVKELIMGNVRRDNLKDIWEKNNILQSLREDIPYKMEGVCGRCIFKAVCLGKCRAEVYYRYKNFTAPFSICQAAYDEGLFPEKYLIPEKG